MSELLQMQHLEFKLVSVSVYVNPCVWVNLYICVCVCMSVCVCVYELSENGVVKAPEKLSGCACGQPGATAAATPDKCGILQT